MSTAAAAPAITLYTAQTPNGVKIPIALEELGLAYKVVAVDLAANTQKEPWFLAINPNGRIPAITDATGGRERHVFESGAILQYLVDTYDVERKLSYPHGSDEYWEVLQWVFFQNAGVGPMQGQAHHFLRYAPEKIPYGVKRYQDETRRLYGVLDARLAAASSGFLVGDRLSIADITTYGWVRSAGWAGIDIDAFPNLKRWEETLARRPAFRKGGDVPVPSRIKELVRERARAEEEEEKARG